MNINQEKQNQILNMFVEGLSVRSISRLTGVHKTTILRLLVMAGNRCKQILNKKMTNLSFKSVQCDEIWTFVHTKEDNLKFYQINKGDQYIFVALDADSKLIPSFYIGKRDSVSTNRFISDLQGRLSNKIQLTTDGFTSYLTAVENAFGGDVDFAQLIKQYHGDGKEEENVIEAKRRYAPVDIIGVTSHRVCGKPNFEDISTSYVERQNLTMRMQMKRFTRLSNAFSKKIENLKAMLAIYFAHYNFMRIHGSLRMTPAMAAGITNRIWDWNDVFHTIQPKKT
jgi:IS1 family transposase